MVAPRDAEVREVADALRARVEDLAVALLGEPNRQRSNWRELIFPGGLIVRLDHPKRGLWFDHSGDAGGDPISLIRYGRQCGFLEAMDWARAWLGDVAPVQSLQAPPARDDRVASDDRQQRITAASDLWSRSVPIGGTIAERYLVEARGILPPPQDWPAALRFNSGGPSLVLAATADDGTLRAVQVVGLTSAGRNATRPDGSKLKLSRGVLRGFAVRLPGSADGPLLLAEGPETGLSVWRASDCETWIALGGIARIPLPQGRGVIVCGDDDPISHPNPRKTAAARAVIKAIGQWREAGHLVELALPNAVRCEDKSDFNDLLQASGLEAVRARLDQVRQVLQRQVEERRRDVAQRVIPPAIAALLAAGRKSAEIFAAAEAANRDAGGWLEPGAVRAACSAARLRQERSNARLWRRRAA